MKKFISESESKERIRLNYNRLSESDYYKIDELFSPSDYDWPGDKEGRALLAFVSHYKISGQKIPCMSQMMEKLPEKLNKEGFLGPEHSETIIEQQLSGHSWMLRGLCEYYEQFKDNYALEMINSITDNLYLPTLGMYSTYPTNREKENTGGVSGSETGTIGNWRLSSDIGCAFMSIDGLSHAYKITKRRDIKTLLDEMISVFLSINKVKLRVQTHCTLTAARGMIRMYLISKEQKYLDAALGIFELYTKKGGMTETYQNLNWWGRPDTWTEPCAVIDSLILAAELYKITENPEFRTVAARIYHNGFSTLQRDNGGAGTDTVVTKDSPWDYLKIQMYEAPFCCSMRLAEGLWYINENRDILYAEYEGKVGKNSKGIYTDKDIIYASPSDELLKFAENITEVDGIKLAPIIKYYRVPREISEKAYQKIIF